MPQYRALKKHYIDEAGGLVEPGRVIDYSGKPGRWLEPVDADAKKAAAEAEKERDARRKAALKGEPDPTTFADIEPRDPPSTTMLVRSHPTVANPEGSSGEDEGDDVPFAAVRRQERKLAAEQSQASLDARAGRGTRRAAKGKRKGSRAAKAGDRRPRRPQSDPVAPVEDA